MTVPPWTVHLLTVDVTRLRLAVPPAGPGAPWLASRALRGLAACGARPGARPDVLGAGRGEPHLTRNRLLWRGLELHLECHHSAGGADELRLELPPWDELVAHPDLDEDAVWGLIDAVAAATGAVAGDLGDGESTGAVAAELRGREGPADRTLPASGLRVVLR